MSTHLRTTAGGNSGSSRVGTGHPHGIEILLKKAKADPAFRQRLLSVPFRAADQHSFP